MDTCKDCEQCPVYSGKLLDSKRSPEAYKAQFCEAGPNGWRACKRRMVLARTGTCPKMILPDSYLTVDEIIKEYSL